MLSPDCTCAAILDARAAELDAEAADHRASHHRRESASVRAKKRAQARELRRMAAALRGVPDAG
jgi:hypothetical protein